MAIKVLTTPIDRNDCVVVGIDGCLRIVDPRHMRCHGYENCCKCQDCLHRATGGNRRAATCSCERPMVDVDICARCGKCVDRLTV